MLIILTSTALCPLTSAQRPSFHFPAGFPSASVCLYVCSVFALPYMCTRVHMCMHVCVYLFTGTWMMVCPHKHGHLTSGYTTHNNVCVSRHHPLVANSSSGQGTALCESLLGPVLCSLLQIVIASETLSVTVLLLPDFIAVQWQTVQAV